MSLDPQIEYVLELVKNAGYPELHELSPADARAQFEQTVTVLDADPADVFDCADRAIDGPHGPIPIRIYTPRQPGPDTPLPVLLWLHGGGFVIGGLESYDSICRSLAIKADCIVVSVDYRLAPEHVFPAAPDDCYAALRWTAAHAHELGGDAQRIAVAGDSAGGNLSAVTAIAARDGGGPDLIFQLLVYPCTAPAPDSASHHDFAEGYLLTRGNIEWFYGLYTPDPTDRQDPRYAPLLCPDLSGLPPALVIVAGYDPLRDEGIAYAERLKEAGVPVELTNYAGMIHGFYSMSGAVDAGREAIDQSAKALRAAFSKD